MRLLVLPKVYPEDEEVKKSFSPEKPCTGNGF
jgi:hypothetical protein